MPKITINSILGGQCPLTHFSKADQFRASLGIDPGQPMDDADSAYSTIASGLLRPSACEKFSGTTITSAPLWLVPNPKTAYVYVYDAKSSAYTIDATMTTVTALADAGTLSGLGNGCEYYDNYIYFSTLTDITRYGPLNGTPGWQVSYWDTTLAKGALTNTTYPTTYKNNIRLPNHILKRHSDGKLYIADVVGNNGTIHYIATKKTTVEGDTDNSSTENKLTFGYGLWPTAIESYGENLAIAFYEGSIANLKQSRAKIAFWDTTSSSFNTITWVEFPDQIITAMKNVNGVLYVVSGNINSRGFRVTKFIGGYSFSEVFYSETGEPCLPGAIDGILNRCLIGTHTTVPESDGCVYSIGLQKGFLGQGIFNIMRASGGDSSTSVTAVLEADNNEKGFSVPIIGWTQAGEGSTGVSHGLDKQLTTYNYAPSVWWSQMYRIGRPFKITRILIPTVQSVGANMTIVPKIYTDNGNGTTYTYTTINNTNYPSKNLIELRNEVPVVANQNFWLELKWTGSALCTVSLPIEVEFEYEPLRKS